MAKSTLPVNPDKIEYECSTCGDKRLRIQFVDRWIVACGMGHEILPHAGLLLEVDPTHSSTSAHTAAN